jgi:hypothetical protein
VKTVYLARFLLLCAAALLAGACGMGVKLAYNNVAMVYDNAAPMLTWMVDDYVDMNGTQKDWVKERIARSLAWHRANELPEYRRFLEAVAEKAEGTFTPADVDSAYRELRGHYTRVAEHLLPHVADFLMQLDADQVRQLERKFAEDNRKALKEQPKGTPEERLQRRAERLFTHVEEFTGHLSAAQRKLLTDHLSRHADLTDMRMVDRRARQVATLALIRARPERERFIAELRKLMVDSDAIRRPEYRDAVQRRGEQTRDMLSELSATLSTAQRQHLQRRLRGYARDFRTLAAAT